LVWNSIEALPRNFLFFTGIPGLHGPKTQLFVPFDDRLFERPSHANVKKTLDRNSV
jgi:hypothetical protein